MSLKVNEIYYSIQGESTHVGRPCIFIRLTYCNLRCTYCDTEYAFYEGKDIEIPEIMAKIKQWNCNLVEVTGGEPLFQDECIDLLNELTNQNYEVLLETGGSLSISDVPIEIVRIVDFKCPSSGMEKNNLWSIVKDLQPHDEVKFVIGDREDFDWAKEMLNKYSLNEKCSILFSPTFGKIDPSLIVEWILEGDIPVRMQLQMHKHIWEPEEKGV
jgi:7-carboxy-7-deazaguanine synthase